MQSSTKRRPGMLLLAGIICGACALGVQALMTGTEPGLFTALGARAQTLAVHDTDSGSQITME